MLSVGQWRRLGMECDGRPDISGALMNFVAKENDERDHKMSKWLSLLAAAIAAIVMQSSAQAETISCPAEKGSPLCALQGATGDDGVLTGEGDPQSLTTMMSTLGTCANFPE